MIRMFRHHLDVPTIVLAACEMSVLYVLVYSLFFALKIYGFDLGRGAGSVAAILATLPTVAGMISVGLYSRDHFSHKEDILSRALVILPVVAIVVGAMLYLSETLIGQKHQDGYYVLCGATLVLFFPTLLAMRGTFLYLVDRTGAFKLRVAVLGSGKRAAKINGLCRRNLDRRFTVIGYLHLGEPRKKSDVAPDSRHQPDRRRDFWVQPEELLPFCNEHKIGEVVVATTERRGLPIRELLTCKLHGINISEYADFWERESGQIDLEGLAPSWLVYSDGFQMGTGRLLIKRVFDLAVSSVLLILTLPLTLPTAALIRLESPGPIFYRQERVGLRGKPFMILKFRSMREDAEKDGPRWAAKNDSRVTRVGAFIRKVRIDEIPQVINVLRGEMAFVGPRPERPVFVSALGEKIPYYNLRHVMKPGITGWAQINYPYGATEEDARMKLAYDFYYIKNGSLFLDIITIMQTVKVLLWNSGAR